MRTTITLSLAAGLLGLAALAQAQPPEGNRPQRPEGNREGGLTQQLLRFDKNKDGKLTKDEVTDERLLPLFERADANKDGLVTAEELAALNTQQPPGGGRPGGDRPGGDRPAGGGGRPGGPGAGGPGGPGGGPGGAGGPGGRGGFGPPQPGQILPSFLQESLKLTPEQKKAVEELQKDIDAKLNKILTADQQTQLKQMRERGPGGPGGPGGGFGRPGGGRPGEGRPPEGGKP